ncbi:MAG TPA: formate--tetrahydrofolate ligase [bacterium]|nr:formate--tetrahydrofolate ligase [bacterium]HNT65575.1 formate--tetrahydrofolate ligase [bacterium]HOX87367.1 formate--tetrahydrofolate ligase [bacterium]HPG46828.1 formate--tetrahydrofolate ligase [bacterium]HPM99192.1 formate--tetrahydrofolate ligase [bacterium]
MKTDLEIAQSIQPKAIQEIAAQLGIGEDQLDLYGKHKAKLPHSLIDLDKGAKHHLILVSAITPTPAGEGKTTVSIGLTQGLNRIGKKTTVVLREPSLGPVFGIKGGATGGGYSQVLPMEDINLHFTGDFSAVEKAHNLLAALLDNNLQSRKHSLRLDPRKINWKRVMDMNDRALRQIVVGLGGTTGGVPRETGFDITAASEVMAILCLAQGVEDLKRRLGNIFVGFTLDQEPIFARDLHADGAMAALLKDAIKPNLVQTIEGNPALIHGGPFANIAQGTNSVLATRTALSLSEFVVTEAGFGFDLGGEKFFDIKCASSGLNPNAVVLVATIRALKFHGGAKLNELTIPNVDALRAGLPNLAKHIENVKLFNVNPIVAINKFTNDTDAEIAAILDFCQELGVECAVADVWGKGGEGAIELAEKVSAVVVERKNRFKPLYQMDWSIEKKIETVAKNIYGAKAIDYLPKAKSDLKGIEQLGMQNLAVCIAKTQKSLSDNPALLGRPENFTLTVREIEIASGAGFIVPITGDIMRMPGLPAEPAAEKIDIDEKGRITGLF